MSTAHMTLLLWYGDTAGVKVNRRYDIDDNDKFKDFFGARRNIAEGVWRQSDEKVLVGSKAYDKMSFDARVLLVQSDNVVLPAHAKWQGEKISSDSNHAFVKIYGFNQGIRPDLNELEQRAFALMAKGHVGTLSGRWPTGRNKSNSPKSCSTCRTGMCTQRCIK